MVRGFALSDVDALVLLTDWNVRREHHGRSASFGTSCVARAATVASQLAACFLNRTRSQGDVMDTDS